MTACRQTVSHRQDALLAGCICTCPDFVVKKFNKMNRCGDVEWAKVVTERMIYNSIIQVERTEVTARMTSVLRYEEQDAGLAASTDECTKLFDHVVGGMDPHENQYMGMKLNM